MLRRYTFTFEPLYTRHVRRASKEAGYELTTEHLLAGRDTFREAIQAHPSELPELWYDYSAGWVVGWEDGTEKK